MENELISRQAAIDIFDDYNVSVENGELEAYSRDRKRLCDLPSAKPLVIHCTDCEDWHDRQSILGFTISEFPSAQPKHDENPRSEQGESDKLGVKTGKTCTDCISRQAAIDALDKHLQMTDIPVSYPGFISALTGWLNELPSAQPEREPAKFIRWMECKKTDKYISYTPHCKCSKCGNELLIEAINYCYMCGAKMEGERRTDEHD